MLGLPLRPHIPVAWPRRPRGGLCGTTCLPPLHANDPPNTVSNVHHRGQRASAEAQAHPPPGSLAYIRRFTVPSTYRNHNHRRTETMHVVNSPSTILPHSWRAALARAHYEYQQVVMCESMPS